MKSFVDLGADSRTKLVGQGDVVIQVFVNGKVLTHTIKNVKHAPIPRYQLLSVITIENLMSAHQLMINALPPLAHQEGSSLLLPP